MSVWRVYLPEFVTVYTSQAKGEKGDDECHLVFRERWQGRVRAEDVIYYPVSRADPYRWEISIRLRLPNRRGEFTDYADAAEFAAGLGPEARIVERWSEEEKALMDYGTRSLS